jgi:hypothetical protein
MFVATKQEMISEAQTRAFRPNKKWFPRHKLVLLMHPDTNFRSGSGAATKWPETIENLSFRPKVVDWACLLQKNKKWF